jgi:hypothetical protein
MSMIVKVNNNTYRVQFIKEVEPRRGGRTTIKTICKIFLYVGEDTREDGRVVRKWEEMHVGVARQNPVDPYNHMIGKRVALQKAMIAFDPNNVIDIRRLSDNEWEEMIENWTDEIRYYFDRVERSTFARALEAEFNNA